MPKLEDDSAKTSMRKQFDFHLTAEDEERAMRLHSDSIVVDLVSQYAGGNIFSHYPTELRAAFRDAISAAGGGFNGLVAATYWPFEMSRLGKSDLLRDWLTGSGLTCGTHGMDVHDGCDPQVSAWEAMIASYGSLPWLRNVTTARAIREAKQQGRTAFYFHCQPVSPIPRDLSILDSAYAKGLRSFMLTYNRMDNVGVGCTERVDAGLSMFGLDVVKHCNDLGIIVDVSHCGPMTTLDACRHSRKPVNANHTAANAVHSHARNKTDEALRAIADTGGVIGVVAVPAFLTDQDQPSIEHMLDHIDYVSRLVGWEHVAIGTDWPIQAPDDVLSATLGGETAGIGFRPKDRLDLTKRLIGFDDCRDLPNITRGLIKRGYDEEQIRGILGENALRVFAEVWGS
jgi:membrane dipeptidase